MEVSKADDGYQFREFRNRPQDNHLLRLKQGQVLVIDKDKEEIKLLDKNNTVRLIISIKEDNLVINVEAYQLNLKAEQELNLSANKINICSEEVISLTSRGNIIHNVSKDMLTQVDGNNINNAKIQNITAELGNVELKANDDIKLNGERIQLNCD